MTENDNPGTAAYDPDGAPPAHSEAVRKARQPKAHEHIVSPGAESTRELREMARRRREAEEKLQQHLQAAKEKPADG